MSKITVTCSAIIINDYEFGDCKTIEENFRIWDPVTHSSYYVGMYYDTINKKLYLPRGIDIWYVEKLIGEPAEFLGLTYKAKGFINDGIYLKNLPRDDIQKETLRFCLAKGEYRGNANYSQLAVNLGTGKGKTYISVATLAYECITTIIIASSSSWLKQWKAKIEEYTNILSKDIYVIVGSANINRLLKYSDERLKSHKIYLVTHSTLQDYAKNYDWYSVGKLFEHLKIGIKIFDEAHLDFQNMCMIDFFTNVKKTYYLTATFGRSDQRENQIFNLAYKNIPKIKLFDPDTDPHTHYYAILYKSHPDPKTISKLKNKYGLDRMGYANYIVTNSWFQKVAIIAMDIGLRYTFRPGTRMLVYIATNDAINYFKNWVITIFPELTNDIGIYTSAFSEEEKAIALSKRVILSTTKSAGAAVDIPGLILTINMAEPFKSALTAEQTLGRTRAANTMYIEMVDTSFKQTYNFYYSKLDVFNTKALDCNSVRMSDEEIISRYNNIMNSRLMYYDPHSAFSIEPGSETWKELYGNVEENKI